MRITAAEFHPRPLRVHSLLEGVPLEDVWAIPFRGGSAGRPIEDVRSVFIASVEKARLIKGLFHLRGRMGALLGWDAEREEWNAEKRGIICAPPQ